MTRKLMEALRKAFMSNYQAGAGTYIDLEHAHALDTLIKADIQNEINKAGETLNEKYVPKMAWEA